MQRFVHSLIYINGKSPLKNIPIAYYYIRSFDLKKKWTDFILYYFLKMDKFYFVLFFKEINKTDCF